MGSEIMRDRIVVGCRCVWWCCSCCFLDFSGNSVMWSVRCCWAGRCFFSMINFGICSAEQTGASG